MELLDEDGLNILSNYIINIFGKKKVLNECINIRKQYLLEIDYENFSFDTNEIVRNTSALLDVAFLDMMTLG